MRQNRAVRVLRGSLAAAVATFVALVSHVTGGGQMPGWAGIVVPLVLSVLVCTVLAGRKLALWRLALAVGTSQVLFHALFVLGTFDPVPAPAGAHHMAGMTMPLTDQTATHLHADPSMWLMHALAAVVTIALLHRGERAGLRLREIAVNLARWARRRLEIAVVPVFLPVRPVLRESAPAPRPSPAPFVSSVIRRGPPAVAVL